MNDLNEKADKAQAVNPPGVKGEGVRKVLLKGIFWRILIIESILLVWSLGYRILSDHFIQPGDLFWYAVRITLLIAVIIMFVMVTFRQFLNKKIIDPLETIARSNLRIRVGESKDFDVEISDDTPLEIKEIVVTRNEMLANLFKVSEERLRLTSFIRETFGKYLSKKIVDNILESPEGRQIGGQRKTVTILMSDIRGFTGLSETLDPEDMVRLLNRYLERMSHIILDYDGIIDEIIGDAILVVFGVPEQHKTDPEHGVACALSMQNAVTELNKEFANEGYPPFDIGIGINTGNVIVGNIGSEVRMKYAVVGSAVNNAARIESNTTGGQIFIGETTYELVQDLITVDPPQVFIMKGIKEPLVAYSVKAMGPPYNLKLTLRTSGEINALKLSFQCRIIKNKKITGNTLEGETVSFSNDVITAVISDDIEPLTDVRLTINFCTQVHCFEDIYAKVVSVEPAGKNIVHKLRITFINPKDKALLNQWIKDAS